MRDVFYYFVYHFYTWYWVYPRLKKWDYKNKKVEVNPTEFSGNDNSNSSPDKFKYRTVPSPYSVVTTDAEFDQGKNSLLPPIFERSRHIFDWDGLLIDWIGYVSDH